MELVNTILNYIAKNSDEEPRHYIGASSIGRPCVRSIWYSYQGAEEEPINPRSQVTFQIGKELESMILEYLKKSGIFIVSQGKFFQDSEVQEFQGHVDGVIVLPDESRAILEIKTAKDSSYNQFVKHGLKKWQEIYYSQLQAYMGMSGIHKGVILAINKNSSEMHEEWVEFNAPWYEWLKTLANTIKSSDNPPPKISDTASYFICKQCHFRRICHYA